MRKRVSMISEVLITLRLNTCACVSQYEMHTARTLIPAGIFVFWIFNCMNNFTVQYVDTLLFTTESCRLESWG
jgi:hypothetical protein